MQKEIFLLKITLITALLLIVGSCNSREMSNDVIASNEVFTVGGDSVVQGIYTSFAPNRNTIVSNFVDTFSTAPTSPVVLRLAFNMRDNEMASGMFHYIDPSADTVRITACRPDTLSQLTTHTIAPDTRCTLKVDLRQMFNDFKTKGVFITAAGDSIFSDEFNGVWVIGNVEPLSWDLLPLAQNNRSKLRPSSQEGFYELDITFAPTEYLRQAQFTGWTSDKTYTDFPQFRSSDILVDAIYNMSVDAIQNADFSSLSLSETSLAALLMLADVKPDLCCQLLKSKVQGGIIRQDHNGRFTFPVVNDRLIWAVAAWQVYLATGNRQWLKYAHKVILATLNQINPATFCQKLHLVHGCDSYSSPEMQYPRWMEPKDYYESLRLSTNAIYAHCHYLLSLIDEELGLDSQEHLLIYRRVKDSINQSMWNEQLGRYCSFITGEAFAMQSNFTCNLAQAACVIFDIADDDRASTLIARTPFYLTGIPTTFPSHYSAPNGNQRPFVQGLWNIAAARTGNHQALRHGLAALYRWAAFHGFTSPEASPSNNLLNACATAAMTLKITAGITLSPEGIEFNPVVPVCFPHNKTVSGIRYRNAIFNLTIIGTGSTVKSVMLDGKPQNTNFFPSTISGTHNVSIILTSDPSHPQQQINITKPTVSPYTPQVVWQDDSARIVNHDPHLTYSVIINRRAFTGIHQVFSVPASATDEHFNIMHVEARTHQGIASQASKPFIKVQQHALTTYPLANFAQAGTTLIADKKVSNVVEFSANGINRITIPVYAPQAGTYHLDLCYSCGAATTAITPLCKVSVNGHQQDVLVMPSRGQGQWRTFGYSNMIAVSLLHGKNAITLQYDVEGMKLRAANQPIVLLKSLRLIEN